MEGQAEMDGRTGRDGWKDRQRWIEGQAEMDGMRRRWMDGQAGG